MHTVPRPMVCYLLVISMDILAESLSKVLLNVIEQIAFLRKAQFLSNKMLTSGHLDAFSPKLPYGSYMGTQAWRNSDANVGKQLLRSPI